MRSRFVVATALLLGAAGFALAQDREKKKDERAFTEEFGEDDADLVPTGKNPFFVLEPGYVLVLEGGGERLVITVLDETKKIGGVVTRVVEERETEDGKLKEVSRNYYAISKRTNGVYYFGEDVDTYDAEEKVKGHGGSWLHGKDGARYGLMMPGTPLLGARHYQELAPTARDRAEILSVSASLDTPAGKLTGCLTVEETTPLEPGNKEHKVYAPGIGLAKDGKLLLVKHGFEKKGAKEPAERPFLGIAFKQEVEDACVVDQVLEGTAAAKAGLKAGDRIVRFDGKKVGAPRELVEAVAARKVGDVVKVTVEREGWQKTLAIALGGRKVEAEEEEEDEGDE